MTLNPKTKMTDLIDALKADCVDSHEYELALQVAQATLSQRASEVVGANNLEKANLAASQILKARAVKLGITFDQLAADIGGGDLTSAAIEKNAAGALAGSLKTPAE